MEPTNYTEKARQRRAYEKRVRDAAPDLLATLTGLVAYASGPVRTEEAAARWADARALLARVRGEA